MTWRASKPAVHKVRGSTSSFFLSYFPSTIFQFKSRERNSVTDSFCKIGANGGMGFKVEDAKTVSAIQL